MTGLSGGGKEVVTKIIVDVGTQVVKRQLGLAM
jgi:hypothetical protein